MNDDSRDHAHRRPDPPRNWVDYTMSVVTLALIFGWIYFLLSLGG